MGKFSNRFEAAEPLEFAEPIAAPPGVPEEIPIAEAIASPVEMESYMAVEWREMGNGKLEPFDVRKSRPKGSA